MGDGLGQSVEPQDGEHPSTAGVSARDVFLHAPSRPRLVAAGPWILNLLIIIGVHAGLLAGLLQYRPQPPLVFQARKPMMVSLISSPVPRSQPAVAAAKPAPVQSDPKPSPPKLKRKPEKVVQPVKKPAPAPRSRAIQVPVQAETVPAPKLAAPRAVQGPPEAPAEPVPPKFSADYLKNPSPDYPLASRRRGEEGKVLLRVLVSAEGGAEQVEIDKSSGFARLDQAAKAAVKNWLFVPARLGNAPVHAWVIVPIVFTLKG
jgi:protein TonB